MNLICDLFYFILFKFAFNLYFFIFVCILLCNMTCALNQTYIALLLLLEWACYNHYANKEKKLAS